MPPLTKFTKNEIVEAAVRVTRKKGINGMTAREIGAELGVSTRPIFTWFDSIDQVKIAVYEYAMELYKAYIERGLDGPIPFLGVWRQYLHFAKEEPELYRLLFLTMPDGVIGGAIETLKFSQDLVRESVMNIYHIDAYEADCYFRNIWLVAFSYATLIVTDNCPYTEEEILAVGTEISLATCKAYKEIPGLPERQYDRDAIFTELVNK